MGEFVEVKTAELVGAALDWAVAKATGADDLRITEHGSICCIYAMPCGAGCWTEYYQPSTDWSQVGPLIEKYGIRLERSRDGHSWFAGWMFSDSGWNARYETFDGEDESGSSSALIAACRAIVASKLGDTVSIPRELLP